VDDGTGEFLWSIKRVSNLGLFGALMTALVGGGGGNSYSNVDAVRSDSDGLLILEGYGSRGGRWIPWDSVVALIPIAQESQSGGTWLELRVDDGPAYQFGPAHLEETGPDRRAAEAERKTAQVVGAWAAWRQAAS
jgi:hypothetical protein